MTAAVTDPRPPGVYPTFEHSIDDWIEGEVDWEVVPSTMGPTWDRDPNWDGPRDPEGYILPHFTLGWQAIRWGEKNLLADETDEDDQPLPFQLTSEQVRFVLWFYAIDENGRFAYRNTILQRLKGAGKDPIAAFIAAIEFVGPCRFAGWATVDMPEKGLKRGDPVAKSHPRAWVQIAAVSLSQPLALDTLVPTPAGIRELRDIRVGDEVFDDRGLPVIVARETEVFEGRPCYRLTFDDGTAVVATDTHGWTLDLSKGRSGDMIQETVSTAELAYYWSTRSRPRARIPLVGRETPDRDDLLIDPYLLGLWLGDGSKSDAGIACSVADADEQSAIIQATITDPTWEVRRTDRQIREGQECDTVHRAPEGSLPARSRPPRQPGQRWARTRSLPPLSAAADAQERVARPGLPHSARPAARGGGPGQ